MPPRYGKRALEPVLKKAVGEFPAVVLTGPRHLFRATRTTAPLDA